MPLEPIDIAREHDYLDEDPGNPFLAFVVVLAALVAIVALVAALSSGGGGASDVTIDQRIPTSEPAFTDAG